MAEIRIGIIGYGKIARDQHVPSITSNPAYRLVAVVAPDGASDAPVPAYRTHHEMLSACDLDAVAICTPAGPRHAIARDCLEAGVDALLEKPPAATLGALDDLRIVAERTQRILFTAWHAQHNQPVAALQQLLRREGLQSMHVAWIEDVAKWHPGQAWIWRPGGFGVFDPGINALSIASLICPAPLLIARAAFLTRSPGEQPIAASLAFEAAGAAGPLTAEFDWRGEAEEQWTISGETRSGQHFALSQGGRRLETGVVSMCEGDREYELIYERFAEAVCARRSVIDAEPLRLVADSFMIAATAACARMDWRSDAEEYDMTVAHTTALERIARVLAGLKLSANAEGDLASAGDVVDRTWPAFNDDAHAVLSTLREPDETMARVGDGAIWTAMINAALGEA